MQGLKRKNERTDRQITFSLHNTTLRTALLLLFCLVTPIIIVMYSVILTIRYVQGVQKDFPPPRLPSFAMNHISLVARKWSANVSTLHPVLEFLDIIP